MTNANRIIAGTTLTASILVCASCLTRETLHDLYVDPDGSVVWTVTEHRIRSTADVEADRRAEEHAYLEAVGAEEHAVARALWRIGARRVFSTVVRDERPYSVVTEGSFDGLDEALGRFFAGLGLVHEIDLHRSPDGVVRLDLTLWDSEAAPGEPPSDEALSPLIDDLEGYRFVLTRGVFVEAVGFALASDDTVAHMLDQEPPDGVARYRLAWKDDPA